MSSSVDNSAIDVDRKRQLAEKYRLERSKRLNPKGNAQYIAVEGAFADFSRDPYVKVPANRLPSTDSVDVLIVGGGIAGLLTAVELRRAGVASFQIIEKGADFGGTWYWNRYPGIACDCESLIYIPLLEELGYTPSVKYAPGEEIGAHLCTIGEEFDLYANAHFQTQVTAIRWSAPDERWMVSTDRGDEVRARFIVLGSGPLHRPKLPGIPGIQEFKGRQFHSSRWDYEYTGGGPRGGLDKLRDKSVAVVGTGSTGVQIVPFVARDAQHLYVVQRTPSIILISAVNTSALAFFGSDASAIMFAPADSAANIIRAVTSTGTSVISPASMSCSSTCRTMPKLKCSSASRQRSMPITTGASRMTSRW